jgi:hypothetical protein
MGRCADFTTVAYARTGDATSGFRNQFSSKKGQNANMEFQYKVDSEEAKEFQLVDSSKLAAGGTQGSRRFVPQAKRRQNAQRLRQLNARRKGDDTYSNQLTQHQRTRNAGRGGAAGRGGRGGGRGGGPWRDRIDRQASGEWQSSTL